MNFKAALDSPFLFLDLPLYSCSMQMQNSLWKAGYKALGYVQFDPSFFTLDQYLKI